MKNAFLLLLPLILIACEKDEKVNEESLIATWRVEASRSASDSLNPNGWINTNFEKQVNSYDIYCVYDANVNQSFLSTVNCAYNNGPNSSIAVDVSGCARVAITRDTTWFVLLKYDITFSSDGKFNWVELGASSRHLDLINQPCNSRVYIPESNVQFDAPGSWTIDESSQIITMDYSPGWSRIDGHHINQFQIISYSGDELIVKHLSPYSAEYRLRKL